MLGITVILAVAALVIERWSDSGQLRELERNSYGQGSRSENLEVIIEDEAKSRSVQIEIEERRYTREELAAVFEAAIDKLDILILGENESLDHIDKPLNLIPKIPDESIEVEWEMDNYDILNAAGELRPENIDKEGSLVELRAILNYGEEQAVTSINVRVFPPIDQENEMEAEILTALEKINLETKESEKYLLPNFVNGKQLVWKQPDSSYSVIIILFGTVAAVYVLFIEKQNAQKNQKKKREQMMLDYPEIVNKLVLLLGAGMTVQKAWNRVVLNYRDQKEREGLRFAYEEMVYTVHELKSNLTETESYERFGRRCNLPEYIKLGALLSQNLKKGTSGLTKMLVLEAENAFAERKSRARKKGEEAGTKLLLPMFLMLVIVLIIIMIPAFLSFKL